LQKKSFQTNGIFLNIHSYPSQYFFEKNWEEIILEFNFKISENNIIRLKLAKVLGYYYLGVKIP
jgi:hypothetical protein